MGKARAKAEKGKGQWGKANSDPRAEERGSRPKDTNVGNGAREKGRGTKGRAGAVDKLVTSRPSAQTTHPCKRQKDKETEDTSGQSKQLAPWCVAPCGKRATWKW